MNNISGIENRCFGCAACFSICPTSAISMEENDEGFRSPIIDDSACINCGKCLRVCPASNDRKDNTNNKVFAGIHTKQDIWARSTSGGAFSAICELFGDEDTYIVGAIIRCDKKTVEHDLVKGISQAGIFSGSKYVQSELGDVYTRVKQLLNEGKKVIFSGTPCQVAGLRKTLVNIDETNLLTIDLFCNGVGSPRVFRDYLDSIENSNNSRIIDYKFRDKRIKFGIHELYRTTIKFENGEKISNTNDVYNSCFVQKVVCRKTCFHCPFNPNTMESDISIGDFKKQYEIVKNSPYNKNGSIIISHTPKGHRICDNLWELMDIFPVDENAYDYPCSTEDKERRRDEFFCAYTENPNNIEILLRDYSSTPGVAMRLWHCIPNKIRERVKVIFKR